MSIRRALLATFAGLALASASLPAMAAPVWIDGGLSFDIRGAVTPTDLDMQRQGFVTAYRAATLRGAIQGRPRPRPQAVLGPLSTLNPSRLIGWTVTTAGATAGVFAPLISGLVPSNRSDAPPGATQTLVSSFNFGELGRLDDGSRAVLRVIEGARSFTEIEDIATLLSTAP